jgi:hypothetical protein
VALQAKRSVATPESASPPDDDVDDDDDVVPEDDDDDDVDDDDAAAPSASSVVVGLVDERSDAPEIKPHAQTKHAKPLTAPRTTPRPTFAVTNVIVSLMPFSARG